MFTGVMAKKMIQPCRNYPHGQSITIMPEVYLKKKEIKNLISSTLKIHEVFHLNRTAQLLWFFDLHLHR